MTILTWAGDVKTLLLLDTLPGTLVQRVTRWTRSLASHCTGAAWGTAGAPRAPGAPGSTAVFIGWPSVWWWGGFWAVGNTITNLKTKVQEKYQMILCNIIYWINPVCENDIFIINMINEASILTNNNNTHSGLPGWKGCMIRLSR